MVIVKLYEGKNIMNFVLIKAIMSRRGLLNKWILGEIGFQKLRC